MSSPQHYAESLKILERFCTIPTFDDMITLEYHKELLKMLEREKHSYAFLDRIACHVRMHRGDREAWRRLLVVQSLRLMLCERVDELGEGESAWLATELSLRPTILARLFKIHHSMSACRWVWRMSRVIHISRISFCARKYWKELRASEKWYSLLELLRSLQYATYHAESLRLSSFSGDVHARSSQRGGNVVQWR